MVDPRMGKLADILVNYSTKVKPGDWVIVSGSLIALPLVNEVVAKVYQAGGNPNIILTDAQFQESKYHYANEEQLQWVSPVTKLIYDKANVTISIGASSNTRALSGVDPKKQQTVSAAHREITKIYMERSASKDLRWTLTNYPCDAYAQEADMSLRDYEDFVFKATFADLEDPVAAWQNLYAKHQSLVDWLAGKKHVEVKGPNVDLSLSIDGRSFINGADG